MTERVPPSTDARERVCCSKHCPNRRDPVPSTRLAVIIPDDTVLELFAHPACVPAILHPNAVPDDPRDHGRIPARASCAGCGTGLPIIGRHPYSLEVGTHDPPDRFWMHADCLYAVVAPDVLDRS